MPSPTRQLDFLPGLDFTDRVSGACRHGVSHAFHAGLLIFVSGLFSLAYVWLWTPFGLSADEAHYWDWSRNLDWSYYSKGPLIAWLIRGSCELLGPLSIRLTGELDAAVRFPAFVCHILLLVGWYRLSSEVFGSPRLGLFVVVAAVALPLVRVGAVLSTIDPPFLACWCWALFFTLKGLETRQSRWWLLAGGITAVGVLAKYTMALFPAAVVAFVLVHRRGELRKPGLWLFLFGSALGWLPVVVWNASNDWVSFRHVLGQVGGHAEAIQWRWGGPAGFLGGQFGMMFGFWLPAFLIAGVRYRPHREQSAGIWLLWWVSVPTWCLFWLASFVKSGQPNWPAPAYVGGFILAAAWVFEQLEGPRRTMVIGAIGFSVVSGITASIAIHAPAIYRPALAKVVASPTESEPYPIRRLDMTARLTGWKALAHEVDVVRSRVATETGAEPVLACTHWTLPGAMGLYCREHPRFVSIGRPNGSDRHSQYDLWRPNPVADAQVFLGRTFVIVGDIGIETAGAFERIEPRHYYRHCESGVPLTGWAIWVCHGFRGFDRTEPTPISARY